MQSRIDRLLTPPEIAAQLGVCLATVRRLIARDGLPAKRIGRQLRVPARAFKQWCDERDVAAK